VKPEQPRAAVRVLQPAAKPLPQVAALKLRMLQQQVPLAPAAREQP